MTTSFFEESLTDLTAHCSILKKTESTTSPCFHQGISVNSNAFLPPHSLGFYPPRLLARPHRLVVCHAEVSAELGGVSEGGVAWLGEDFLVRMVGSRWI